MAIKARVQELEMEEEAEGLKEEEDERCDVEEMQLLTSSPQPGERAHMSCLPSAFCATSVCS